MTNENLMEGKCSRYIEEISTESTKDAFIGTNDWLKSWAPRSSIDKRRFKS